MKIKEEKKQFRKTTENKQNNQKINPVIPKINQTKHIDCSKSNKKHSNQNKENQKLK